MLEHQVIDITAKRPSNHQRVSHSSYRSAASLQLLKRKLINTGGNHVDLMPLTAAMLRLGVLSWVMPTLLPASNPASSMLHALALHGCRIATATLITPCHQNGPRQPHR